MIAVGIDLSGSIKRPSGFCVMNENLEFSTKILFTNGEIIKETILINPDVIAIDAPLFLPKGRISLRERNSSHLRECDKELLRMKIKIFPPTLGPMRKLTVRGIKLRKLLNGKGYEVIEVYPGAAQDILGIPRKGKGILELKNGLEKIGIKNIKDDISHHELDAITCAYVGIQYLKGKYVALGDVEEGLLIIPSV